MKKFILTAVLSSFALIGMAQANKPVVTIEKFTGNNASYVTELRNKVISAVQETGRVNVVDVTNEAALNAELERRKSELAMADAGRVNDMAALMANCILKGQLDNMTTTRKESRDSKGKLNVSYSCNLKYTLTLVNAENGTVLKQQNFDVYGTGATQQLAEQSALNLRVGPVKRFILNAFAVGGKVIAVDQSEKGKAKTVYIDLGKDDGVKKGQKMDVFKVIEIAGEKSNKNIGEIEVVEVMSASRSLCKVKKGADVILTEIEAGSTLPIETKEEKANFFKQMLED